MKRIVVLLFFFFFILTNLVWPEMFNEARAQRAVKFFESLKHTKGRFYGQPFILLPWQKEIITNVYGQVNELGYRLIKYVYLEIPKKNGKSELAAGASLYHLFADGELKGEVYGCAADRQQASIVFDVAADMVDQIPALKKRAKLNLSTKRITDRVTGTFYQVLSAEAFTKHGLNVSAVVFDELHAQPNRNLWDVMIFGSGDARTQPIWWVITTAGDDPDRVSIGWEQHEYASKLKAGEIIDPSWYAVIYGYEGDDIYNEENWFKANPSLGHIIKIETVREAAEKAKMNPADERLFRWMRLNQWITNKLTSWQPVSLFDETKGDWNRLDLLGHDCYVGMDLSSTTDLTAICAVFPPQKTQLDWRVIWHCWIPQEGMKERIEKDRVPYDQWEAQGWITPTPGDVVDYTLVEDYLLRFKKLYKVIEIDSDRAFATMLLQRLENADFTCVDIPQTFASLTDPMNQIEVLLKNHQMSHENNPVARWCFGNTSIAKNGSGLIKYVKEHRGKSIVRTKRIDLIAAWVCAMARARFYEGKINLDAQILNDDWGM